MTIWTWKVDPFINIIIAIMHILYAFETRHSEFLRTTAICFPFEVGALHPLKYCVPQCSSETRCYVLLWNTVFCVRLERGSQLCESVS